MQSQKMPKKQITAGKSRIPAANPNSEQKTPWARPEDTCAGTRRRLCQHLLHKWAWPIKTYIWSWQPLQFLAKSHQDTDGGSETIAIPCSERKVQISL